jgi:hypothetical protein
MEIGFAGRSLQDARKLWRQKLVAAEHQYEENRNEETCAEYRRVLKIFADLVLRNKMPDSQ